MLNLLKRYREIESEIEAKKIKIEQLEEEIKYNNFVYTENREEYIEGEALQSNIISDMPHSTTNKFNSKTENVAIFEQNYNIDVEGKKLEINCLKKQIAALERDKRKVDALIISLSDKERFVTELYYFNGYTFEEIVNLFSNRFGYGSKRCIQEIRDKAINKMQLIYKKSA